MGDVPGPVHWMALWGRTRHSLRDGTSVPCFIVSIASGEVIVQASGERRTFACDTDLLHRYLDVGEAAWGIEAPVEIDLEQRLLMIFKPVSASAREAGAEGAMQVVTLFGPPDSSL